MCFDECSQKAPITIGPDILGWSLAKDSRINQLTNHPLTIHVIQ